MMIRDFRKRFYVTLVLSVPVLALSELIQKFLGFRFSFTGDGVLVFILASLIYLYGGRPFLKGLVDELKKRSPGMMTLIGLAITVAYLYSAAVSFGLQGTPFYWELATLIAIMLAGHWIEMASVLSASSALEKLAQLMPSEAHRKRNDEIEDIPLSEVRKGDLLVIKPGEKIPSDGVVISGESYIDESMLTGESRPVHKLKGDQLIGGSINGDGSLELQVEGAGGFLLVESDHHGQGSAGGKIQNSGALGSCGHVADSCCTHGRNAYLCGMDYCRSRLTVLYCENGYGYDHNLPACPRTGYSFGRGSIDL